MGANSSKNLEKEAGNNIEATLLMAEVGKQPDNYHVCGTNGPEGAIQAFMPVPQVVRTPVIVPKMVIQGNEVSK